MCEEPDEIEELRRRVEELRADRRSVLLDYDEGLYAEDGSLNEALALEIAAAERVLDEAKAELEDEQLPVM